MSLTEVSATVGALIDTDPAALDIETPLREQNERWDSMTVLDAVAAVEDEYGIEIDVMADDLLVTFVSVASIAALIESKRRDQVALSDF